MHKNALGYLLQQGEEGNSELLHQAIHALLDDNISVTTLDNISAHRYQSQLALKPNLKLLYLNVRSMIIGV